MSYARVSLAGEGGACPEPAEGMRGMPPPAPPGHGLIDSDRYRSDYHLPFPDNSGIFSGDGVNIIKFLLDEQGEGHNGVQS